jgi:hypothetical protein
MAEFASLWVGRPLSKIEQTCLASFVYHKHDMIFFVYDMDLAVPKGVVKRDAREILPENKIFKTDNSYGPFADMFRYNMIQKTGLTWTDTDNICLQNRWRFPDYLFGMQGGPHKIVANGLLRAPKNSPLIKDLVNIANDFDKKKIKWGEIGPQLLTEKIHEYKLNKYIQEPQVFYPVHYWEWKDLFDPEKRNVVLRKTRNSHTVQIWHQMLNREGFDNNNFPKGSAMDYFYKKYVGESK